MREWISVEASLPRVGEWVNVLYDRNEGDFFDQYRKPRYEVYGAQIYRTDEEGTVWLRWKMPDGGPINPLYLVTHWMPLPEPPKE